MTMSVVDTTRTLPSGTRRYEDPWVKLSMSIVKTAALDYIRGCFYFMKVIGHIPEDPMKEDSLRELNKQHWLPPWVRHYVTADKFIGSRWYYSLVEDLDPDKLKRMCLEEAMDILASGKGVPKIYDRCED